MSPFTTPVFYSYTRTPTLYEGNVFPYFDKVEVTLDSRRLAGRPTGGAVSSRVSRGRTGEGRIEGTRVGPGCGPSGGPLKDVVSVYRRHSVRTTSLSAGTGGRGDLRGPNLGVSGSTGRQEVHSSPDGCR